MTETTVIAPGAHKPSTKDGSQQVHGSTSPVQQVKVELGEDAQRTLTWLLPTIFVFAFVSAFAAVSCILLYIKYQQTETEVRMQEYYLMELDGKLMHSGFLDPKDSWAGKQHGAKAP